MAAQNVSKKICFLHENHKQSDPKYKIVYLRFFLVNTSELLVHMNYFGKGDIDQKRK